MEYQNFSSMPPEEEATFVIYERTSAEAKKKAMTLGAISGVAVGVFALMLFFSYDKPRNAHAVDPVSDIEEEAPAPKTKPAPAAVEPTTVEPTTVDPAAVDPAAADPEAAAPTDPAAADPTTTPPAGATKAPPTALVNP